jgi:hypothetical protein
LEASSESDSSVASWSEDEDCTKEEEETEAGREPVSDNAPSTQKTSNLKWNQTSNFEDIETFYNHFQKGQSHNFPVGIVIKYCFSMFVGKPLCETVAEETNKLAAFL